MTTPSTPILLAQGLIDRGVVVTGAASGVGRATAQLLAQAGARVCAVDITADALEETVAGLAGEQEHFGTVLDLGDTEAIEPAMRNAAERLGGVHALIHAAAYLKRVDFDAVTEELWDRHADVNLKGTFFLNRVVGSLMIEQQIQGRIVNFTSTAFLTGPVFGSDAYVANKSGIIAMSRGLARRFGRHGITVNVIAPGQIDTPMQTRDNDPAVVAAGIAECPLGRMGDPAEVAAVAVFLVSDHASFVSGATVNVSGAAVLY